MGVWQRSPPASIALTRRPAGQLRRALPDWQPYDVVGSPYCVRGYVVDDHLVDEARSQRQAGARARGMGLILDFVPNHVLLIIHDPSKPQLSVRRRARQDHRPW